MKSQEKTLKEICKKLGIPIPAGVCLPTEEEIDEAFNKIYAANYFDDACELIHTKDGFTKGYLTALILKETKWN